ncbi:hypothetical protein TcBrA4_0008130 [Trypanosoma cruzi]|nr:hypothetical protein TcBrA4_0008130 [Trypanosoma cruzi]
MASDLCCVFNQGVVSMKTAMSLFRGILSEKGLDSCHLTGILELLRSYDLIIMGSRLKFSSFMGELRENKSHGMMDTGVLHGNGPVENDDNDDDDEEEEEEEEETAGASVLSSEFFMLIPACFKCQPPSAFNLHLPSFLFGPSTASRSTLFRTISLRGS